MTDTQLAQFKSNYAEMIIEGMDYKTMEAMIYDVIMESFELFTEDEMKQEIFEQYGTEDMNDLLGGNL